MPQLLRISLNMSDTLLGVSSVEYCVALYRRHLFDDNNTARCNNNKNTRQKVAVTKATYLCVCACVCVCCEWVCVCVCCECVCLCVCALAGWSSAVATVCGHFLAIVGSSMWKGLVQAIQDPQLPPFSLVQAFVRVKASCWRMPDTLGSSCWALSSGLRQKKKRNFWTFRNTFGSFRSFSSSPSSSPSSSSWLFWSVIDVIICPIQP